MRQFPQIPSFRSLSSIVILDFFSDFSVDSFTHTIDEEELNELQTETLGESQSPHRSRPEYIPSLATDAMNWDYIT